MSDMEISDSDSDSDFPDSDFPDIGMRETLREIADRKSHFEYRRKLLERRERILSDFSSQMRSFLETEEPAAFVQYLRRMHLDIFNIRTFNRICELSMDRANITTIEREKVAKVIDAVLEGIESDIQAVVQQLKREHDRTDYIKHVVDREEQKAKAKNDEQWDRAIYKFWTM